MYRTKTETVSFTRRELYELVWNEPFNSLATKYLISDVGLRKMCLRNDIPVPPKGYWFRDQKNKKGKTKLPEKSQEVVIQLEAIGKGEVKPTSLVSELSKQRIDVEQELKEMLMVPLRLKLPSELITDTVNNFKAIKEREYNSIIRDALNIKVNERLENRALRIFDTLIKCLKARKHNIEIINRKTYAVIFGREIEVHLKEKERIIKLSSDSWPKVKYEPTGNLYFGVKGTSLLNKQWYDSKKPLEHQLSEIIAFLELKGIKENKWIKESQAKQMKIEEEAQRKAQLRKTQDLELEKFKALLADAERWRKINLMREYVSEVEKQTQEGTPGFEDTRTWVKWAKQKIDWYDPFINAPDDQFENLDKITLTFNRTSSLFG